MKKIKNILPEMKLKVNIIEKNNFECKKNIKQGK